MFYLAWRNITRRLGSSVLTAFIAFMAVLALTASMIVVTSLEDGVRLSRERLGADIMVLPAGASGNASEVLFCAEPVNVYLPASAAEAVAATEGVAASTPQFFTQTVDQSCCSVVGVTRVVGIDATTDFVLAPWIVGGVEGAGDAGASAEVDDFGLGDDGILLGSAAPAIEGGQASILGSVFHVAGTLAPTGTSVDETIFMDIDAARTIAAASPYLESVWGDADPFDAVSCLMVKAADGSDIDALCQALVDAVPGSVAVRTADMVSGASSQLAVVEAIAVAFLIVLVILAALALAGRFSALAASRMRELGLLRTFGMGRGRVVGCFACEIGLVTLVAAVVAVVVACLVAGSVVGTFHSEFNMPGAAVPASAYGAAVAVGLLFAVALTAVALVQPVVQMLRRDPQETLTRGLIELKGVVKEFRSVPPVRPLDGVSLAVAPGRIVAVTGVSGKGKSTLLNVMGGLLRADEGSVLYHGTDLARASAAEIDAVHRRGIGFVFQSPYLFPALTARENMVMALRAAGQSVDGAAIETMLEEVGLTDRADHLPAELSVGQKRRLVLARVLLAQHDLLLADEPTNDLDADWSDEVFDRFRAFVAAGDRSVVVVTHDEAYARQADEVYVLEEGRLARREEVASC